MNYYKFFYLYILIKIISYSKFINLLNIKNLNLKKFNI